MYHNTSGSFVTAPSSNVNVEEQEGSRKPQTQAAIEAQRAGMDPNDLQDELDFEPEDMCGGLTESPAWQID